MGPHAMTATHQLNPEAVNVPLDPSDHRMEEVRHDGYPQAFMARVSIDVLATRQQMTRVSSLTPARRTIL